MIFCLNDASFDVFLQHLAFMLYGGKQNDNTFPLYFHVKTMFVDQNPKKKKKNVTRKSNMKKDMLNKKRKNVFMH